MHQIILSWTTSNVEVLSYFKLDRTPELYREPSHALGNKLYVIGFYSWRFFPVFDGMCKYSKERRKELMESMKIEQQIPVNHERSIFNGLLLKIKEKSGQNKREVLLDKIDSSVILTSP